MSLHTAMACWQLAAKRDEHGRLVLPCHIGTLWVAKGSSCLPPDAVRAVGTLQAGADPIAVVAHGLFWWPLECSSQP